MGTARIVTDAGPAYIKALGNPQGPHPLACEWVATQLAQWFQLPTFPFALLQIDDAIDEIPFFRGGNAASGTAFVTQAVAGHAWGGSTEELRSLVNPQDVSRLVVFDNWVLNCDRHPPDLTTRSPNYDNVFLADVRDTDGTTRSRLMAMDHTHCFTCGLDLNGHVANINRVKDCRLYGLFPGFKPLMHQLDVESAINRLRELESQFVAEVVDSIPNDWDVSDKAKRALTELICRRSHFVADTVLSLIATVCWPGQLFDNR